VYLLHYSLLKLTKTKNLHFDDYFQCIVWIGDQAIKLTLLERAAQIL